MLETIKKKRFIILVLAVVCVVIMTACSEQGNEEDLIGRWVIPNTSRVVFIFHEDGRVVYNTWRFGEAHIHSTFNGTWTVNDGLLTIDLGDHVYSGDFTFRIRENSLTISGGNENWGTRTVTVDRSPQLH